MYFWRWFSFFRKVGYVSSLGEKTIIFLSEKNMQIFRWTFVWKKTQVFLGVDASERSTSYELLVDMDNSSPFLFYAIFHNISTGSLSFFHQKSPLPGWFGLNPPMPVIIHGAVTLQVRSNMEWTEDTRHLKRIFGTWKDEIPKGKLYSNQSNFRCKLAVSFREECKQKRTWPNWNHFHLHYVERWRDI